MGVVGRVARPVHCWAGAVQGAWVRVGATTDGTPATALLGMGAAATRGGGQPARRHLYSTPLQDLNDIDRNSAYLGAHAAC